MALPLIDIAPVRDPRPLQHAWHELPQFALVMFVSANAVRAVLAARARRSAAWPAQVLAGSTGPGTSTALRQAGVPRAGARRAGAGAVSSIPRRCGSGCARATGAAARVLVVRGDGGRDWLAERLRDAGRARSTSSPPTSAALPRLDAPAQALLDAALAAPQQHLWLFSSSEAVGQPGRCWRRGADWSRAAALATHPRIAARARQLGLRRGSTPAAADAGGGGRAVAYNRCHRDTNPPPS